MKKESKLLGICSVCKSIRISNNPPVWMSRDVDPNLYDMYMKKYKDNLTHGYCPDDYEKAKKELDEFKKRDG